MDLLVIAESKLDCSFPDALFKVDNYHFWRKDRTKHGGGIAMYVRSDIAGDLRCDQEFGKVESICTELVIGSRKWLFTGLYRPPTMSDKTLLTVMIKYQSNLIMSCYK